MILNRIEELIGNTPVVKIKNLVDEDMADIYIKLENFNLSGSIKIRAAYYMIKEAIESKKLVKGMKLVEPTSGNTGIALAYIANLLGFEIVLTMPESMSLERRQLMQAYNAKLVLTPKELGMKAAIEKAEELVNTGEYIMLQQFNNKANVKAHYETTALEIINDFENIDAFVVGVGTGGSITGIGTRLKQHYKKIEIVAIEPSESSVLSGEKPGAHKIQGIGAGFIPNILDVNIYDEIIKIPGVEAFEFAKEVFLKEGLFLGISSAANLLGSLQVARRLGKNHIVLTIAPDGGEKYLVDGVFNYGD